MKRSAEQIMKDIEHEIQKFIDRKNEAVFDADVVLPEWFTESFKNSVCSISQDIHRVAPSTVKKMIETPINELTNGQVRIMVNIILKCGYAVLFPKDDLDTQVDKAIIIENIMRAANADERKFKQEMDDKKAMMIKLANINVNSRKGRILTAN